MSCGERRNKRFQNIDVVRVLAQHTANLTGVTQKLYKHECYGITTYRFSDDWKGKVEEFISPKTKSSTKSKVRRNIKHTSKAVLQDNEDKKLQTTKPGE